MPPIPKLPTGDYDYAALTTKLTEIKSNRTIADETKATFNADAITPYDIVVEDAGCHAHKDEKDQGKSAVP